MEAAGTLCLVHAEQLNGKTVAGALVLPASQVTTDPAAVRTALELHAEEPEVLRMGVTFWPINEPQRDQHLGLMAMVIAPIGQYDRRQVLNASKNRWRLVLGGGWQREVTRRFLVDLSSVCATAFSASGSILA